MTNTRYFVLLYTKPRIHVRQQHSNVVQDPYSTATVGIRNRKAAPGWISDLIMFYTNFSIMTPEFISCECQPAFVIARFLVTAGVLY